MSTIAGWKQSPRSSPRHSVILRAWRAVETSWREQRSLLFSTEARRGGLWGISGVLTLFFAVRLLYLPSGFGLAFDAALLIAATAIVITLIALIVAGVLTLIRNLPLAGTGVFVGACLLLTLGWFSTLHSRWSQSSSHSVWPPACSAPHLLRIGSSWRRHSPAARTVAALVFVAAGHACDWIRVVACRRWRPREALVVAPPCRTDATDSLCSQSWNARTSHLPAFSW